VPNDNIDLSIPVEISDRQSVRDDLGLSDGDAGGERSAPLSEVDGHAGLFVDRHDVCESVAVEIRGFRHANVCFGRTERHPARIRKAALRRGEIQIALPSVAMRHDEIDQSIVIEVGRCYRRRWIMREGNAVGVESAAALVQADIVGPR
jgi:hypothetical protein